MTINKRNIGEKKYLASAPTPEVMVTFYDNFMPSLVDGEYTIKIEHGLEVDVNQTKNDGGNPTIGPVPKASQTFVVRGPRFSLDPTDIHRAFPPPNNTGVYDSYLPMLVFNKRALPWERKLRLVQSQKPSGFQDNGLYPWLALLVFSEDELLIPRPPSGDDVPVPPDGSRANPTRSAAFALKDIVNTTGPRKDTLCPSISLAIDEDPSQIFCNVIDISTDTFRNLVPSVADLRFLAHVRQVSTVNKEPLSNAPHDGWFSTVIANRFSVPPAKGSTLPRRNIAHLVSLEGFEPYLDPPLQPSPVPLENFKRVRLISLYSWTFNCLSEPGENFRELMLNLISTQSEQGTNLLLRMPPPTSLSAISEISPYVAPRLQDGYVPLSYAMRTGEESFAWYRGPLAPVPTKTFLGQLDPDRPDDRSAPSNVSEAMVYDPQTGLFDQSYAVAFQTGRSLALANQVFAVNMLQWRRAAHNIVDRLMERMSSRVLRGVLQKKPVDRHNLAASGVRVADLVELLGASLLSKSFKKLLTTQLHGTFAKSIGKPKSFDPTAVNAELKTVMEARPLAQADLGSLMQQPAVVSLLEHLSAIDSLGTTSSELSGTLTGIPLQSPGLSQWLNEGSSITVTSPDGKTVETVDLVGSVDPGDATINVVPHRFQSPMPVGSTLHFSQATILPTEVINWLAQTALLYSVPFNNLVPNVQMLQPETIRFFYVDQNWVNALIDGALSVGIQSSRDVMLGRLMRTRLHSAVNRTLWNVRDKLRSVSPTGAPTQPGAGAGFLLRSVAVSSVPGLEVRAWSSKDKDNPMKPLRLDRVANDLMIGIFPDVPVKLEFNEPSEGLVFGFENEGIALRYLPGMGVSSAEIGSIIDPTSPTWVSVADIQNVRRPLDIDQPPLSIAGEGGLVETLQNKFPSSKPPLTKPALTPGSFAVEMVRVPQQMLFLPENTGASK